MSISAYITSRFTTIRPSLDPAPNPFKLLASVSQKQWTFFLVCLYLSPIILHHSQVLIFLAEQFHKTNAEISWGITLALMFRSVGAITFGIAADRYGGNSHFWWITCYSSSLNSGADSPKPALGFLPSAIFSALLWVFYMGTSQLQHLKMPLKQWEAFFLV